MIGKEKILDPTMIIEMQNATLSQKAKYTKVMTRYRLFEHNGSIFIPTVSYGKNGEPIYTSINTGLTLEDLK
jgi:hypothetical protein